MQYMLMIYGSEAAEESMTESQMGEVMGAYKAYSEALVKAGVMAGGERLKPTSAATTVRVVSGKTEVLNGPYADTKEQLGGYYLINVPDLDAALSWAARCPGASHGTVEVRPVWAM
jgi:hypothetical protein